MNRSRRTFIQTGTVAGIGAGLAACSTAPAPAQAPAAAPAAAGPHPAIAALTPMTASVKPITADERAARIEKARRLMVDNKIGAIYLEGGSSMFYFTGVRWGNSERTFACVIPAKGDLAWVCPAFEEERARELVKGQADVRVWQEDESPYRLIAGILKDRAATGRVGVDERLRHFIFSGVKKELPGTDFVDGEPITAGCRMIKSATELALMQKASDITIEAFRAAFQTFREGMTQDDLRANIAAAHRALGAPGGSASVSFGKFTAFPHGSIEPQKLAEGDVIQVDGGCAIDGYQSDITRTTVLGKASARQIEIWELEKKAQAAAYAVVKPGTPCEAVDAAARKVITDAGFGPDYKVPGLPHRTGHGIGLDGHEWTNFVRGNKTLLAPGMCFSNEPMIAIYGEFGIRLEDCLYVTETGAQYFSQPSPSIDKPFA